MILILDFGSQTCHLIARRIQELGITTKIIDPEISLFDFRKLKPSGLILSGGPASIYEKGAPSVDPSILKSGIPTLGICYGWQLISHLLGGKVISGHKEYGPKQFTVQSSHSTSSGQAKSKVLSGLPRHFTVWLSHGDTVVKLPKGFRSLGSTENVKNAFVSHPQQKLFGVQFHPEVTHTQFGTQILKNFVQICGLKIRQRKIKINEILKKLKSQVGSSKVVVAVSGGVDSTTTAALLGKALGKNFYPIYVESGLMRTGTKEEIREVLQKILNVKPIIVEAQKLFLKKLQGITDPEKKRQIIGRLYIELFEKEAKKIPGVEFLAQGTIYSDVIESKGSKKADKIKSHHNVGGLPEKMGLKLIEPLRFFYKDEVRLIAKELGLPDFVIYKQPFPGPGQAIRIIGEVTKERLEKQQQADQIVLEELKKAGWLEKVFQSFPVLTGTKSTAVKGDARFWGEVVALRIYESADIMTADWAKLPYELLQKISSQIVNEVPGVSRVVYDITSKPPATMEWE